MRPESEDWESIRELEARLKSGRYKLTAAEIATVHRVAAQLGLQQKEVQTALELESGYEPLVVELQRRIREGSRRLMRAFTQAQQLLDQGDAEGAREVLETARSEEEIPFYRETVEAQLQSLGL